MRLSKDINIAVSCSTPRSILQKLKYKSAACSKAFKISEMISFALVC